MTAGRKTLSLRAPNTVKNGYKNCKYACDLDKTCLAFNGWHNDCWKFEKGALPVKGDGDTSAEGDKWTCTIKKYRYLPVVGNCKMR
jgi:hypothetical protein